MAREFAQIKLALWEDDDVRLLSPEAQHLYFVLLTSRSLNYCGVGDWRPRRIAALAQGWTVERVEDAATELVERLFVVIDESTEEILVRSFVRHDGLMKQPKMATAMAAAHGAVASSVLRGVVVHELRRLQEDFPDLKGWGSEKASDLLRKASVDPSVYPLGKGPSNRSGKGSGEGLGNPKPKGSGKGSPTPAPNSSSLLQHLTPRENAAPDGAGAAAPESYPDDFEAAWLAYERKGSKRKSFAEWRRAIKRADPTVIVDAIPRYFASVSQPRYRKDFERYLAGDLWESAAASAPPIKVWAEE